MNSGMTLTSLLLAVALSGIIAVFGGRLIVNQMYMSATAELIDKGNTIMQFYLNILRDREVWRCTMFDTDNTAFKNYVLGNGGAVSGVNLRGPNCDWHDWRSHPNLTDAPGFKRGDDLLPDITSSPNNYKYIGDSITEKNVSSDDGWWKLGLIVKSGGGKGDVDLELILCLEETVYTDKHKKRAQVPRGYKYKCSEPETDHMIRRVRYSENAIRNTCSRRAVTEVGDRTGVGVISVDCLSSPVLLQFFVDSVDEHKLAPDGLNRTSDRQAIEPIPIPSNRHPIVGINTNGKLTIGTDRALVRSLAARNMLCGKDNSGTGMEKVLCGFTNMGEKICCTPKGPKGPKGLKGCRPAIRRDVHNSSRICISTPNNTGHCPHENDSDGIIDDPC